MKIFRTALQLTLSTVLTCIWFGATLSPLAAAHGATPQIIVQLPVGYILTNGLVILAPPIILTNGAGVDFGNGVVGGKSRGLNITNAGGATLSAVSLSITGTHASEFLVTTTPATSVPPGGETAFAVTFSPAGLGMRSAELRILSNDPDDSSINIKLTGTGVSPFRMLRQAYVKPSDTETNDQFGTSVAISGDTMVIGAPNECSGSTGVNGNQMDQSAFQSGAAYVFVRHGTNWTQQAYLKASNTDSKDHFGDSVAVFGDTIVIGAPGESSSAVGINGNQLGNSASNSGAAYVFVRVGANWRQQAYLKASNTDPGDRFGDSVAISEDVIVVGATIEASSSQEVNGDQNDNSSPYSGAAYVFARTGTNWVQQAYLKAPLNDGFGLSVAVSGNTVVAGGVDMPASVFARTGTNWTREAVLTNNDACKSVAIAGDTVVVGIPEDSSFAGEAGAAHVYVRSGTNWLLEAKLGASNAGEDDNFGASVAISGDAVVVGATGEGISDEHPPTGAAYVFVRRGTIWTQQAFLKFTYAEANALDDFGASVALSGNTAVIGAPGENSEATGINSNRFYGAYNSGAAFVYSGLGLGPKLAIRPDGHGMHSIRVNTIPGATNRLQYASNILGSWLTLATSNAPASGTIEFQGIQMPAPAFFRIVSP